jgi:hypothetical protein
MSQPEPQMTIYLSVGVRTSQGPGPGVKTLPASEALSLVSAKYAVAGTSPPDGMGGQPEPSARPFPAAQGRVRAAQSN